MPTASLCRLLALGFACSRLFGGASWAQGGTHAGAASGTLHWTDVGDDRGQPRAVWFSVNVQR
ncbi:MAG TPA: hypothetical protein VEQ67_23675, partial [Mycobacterium sp.]|nr:hypothetical protein [Mycobacterium sp.]